MKTTIFILALPVLMFAQPENEMKIRLLQYKRLQQSQELFSFLKSEQARDRELAMLALANIQDTSAVENAAQLLNDESPKVRSMAAFAIGMIGKPRGTSFLFRRLAVEREEKCAAALFNAIGMCGTADDLKKIISQSEDFRRRWKPFVAQAVIRFANRKIKDVAASKYMGMLLNDNACIIHATYALMRINDTTVITGNREKLQQQLSNASSLVRMWSAAALGAVNDEVSIGRLQDAAMKDGDWRVRVNAIRALRTKSNFRNDLIKLIADKNDHIALTALSSYDALTTNEVQFIDSLQFIAMLQSGGYGTALKEEVRTLIAKKLGERAIPLIGSWMSDRPSVSAQRVRSYGETRSEKAIPMIKEAIRQTKTSLVVIAGIESYQAIAQRSNESVKKDFLKIATLMFGRNDPGISYSSAVAFQDTSFSKDIRKIYLSALISTYQRMNAAADLEPMVELQNVFADLADSSAMPAVEQGMSESDNVIRSAAEKAYAAITGVDAPVRSAETTVGESPFYTMEDVLLLKKFNGAEIFTSKGKIRITFEKEAAPFTVLNFILLAQKKFYDGLSFHRVVSNFVIQGGDPLGNGSGGPNYAIRSEVHPDTKYKTGAVGMASSGKDTEGSQWFITHCPTPHLDFRYTVFGYTPDSKIVDRIMIGDAIEKIVLF
jgi:peptidylprolyl isomerase